MQEHEEESFEDQIKRISEGDQWKQGVDNLIAMTAHFFKGLMEEELEPDVATELTSVFLNSLLSRPTNGV